MFSRYFIHWLLALAFAQPGFFQSTDIASSGTYLILKCDAGNPNSRAAKLQALLPQIFTTLQAVIADASLGTASRHGYATFFQNDDNIASVQGIYRNIAAGSPVSLPQEGRTVNPLFDIWPTLVCIQPGDTTFIKIAALCELGAAAGIFEKRFVALCPNFWEWEEAAGSLDCPRVRRNTLTPNTDDLTRNQQGMLVHELAHIYGVTSNKDWKEGEFETYNINDAANLDVADALLNAQNYAYYYSGKYSQSFLGLIAKLVAHFTRKLTSESAMAFVTDLRSFFSCYTMTIKIGLFSKIYR